MVADGEPVFAEADHYIPATEYEYWLPEPDFTGVQLPEDFLGMMRATAEANLGPLADADRWIKIEGEETIQPGVAVTPAPGHTPGHVSVIVESEGESLVHLVDTVVHPLQISNPSWAAGFDHQQETVADTRQKLLETAAQCDVAMASHFPAPGFGKVVETEGGFEWDAMTS
jgi:glyoxylase-like metal-dependent hydrolase (beta-lactamase superfamily II)